LFNNKIILITGGTGSFGKNFTKRLLCNFKPKKIIIFSRDEFKQSEMKKELSSFNQLRFFLGDVRDLNRLSMALKDVDYVIHAAALKQVDAIEYNPFEAVKTNIIGAQNLITACLENKVKKVIALSTDKASAPINLYGATKLVSDKLFTSANSYSGYKNLLFSVVRYGNVFGSRGSIAPHFYNILKNKTKILPITDVKMTRFNITLNESIDFVIKSMKVMKGGEIFIPKLKSYRVIDLASAFLNNPILKIQGVRPGEKIHENLTSDQESNLLYESKSFYVLFQADRLSNNPSRIIKKYDFKLNKVKKGFSLKSDQGPFLSISMLNKLINSENHLF
tara:strand:+ start:1052 stop:2056 length:1005 start_codon:yes stop_codon:yes gene_type:complete